MNIIDIILKILSVLAQAYGELFNAFGILLWQFIEFLSVMDFVDWVWYLCIRFQTESILVGNEVHMWGKAWLFWFIFDCLGTDSSYARYFFDQRVLKYSEQEIVDLNRGLDLTIQSGYKSALYLTWKELDLMRFEDIYVLRDDVPLLSLDGLRLKAEVVYYGLAYDEYNRPIERELYTQLVDRAYELSDSERRKLAAGVEETMRWYGYVGFMENGPRGYGRAFLNAYFMDLTWDRTRNGHDVYGKINWSRWHLPWYIIFRRKFLRIVGRFRGYR